MKKLYCIRHMCNYYGEYEFESSKQDIGRIIVDEDGWFEGYMRDPFTTSLDRMIFGIMHDKKAIKMYSISVSDGHEPTISEGINEEISSDENAFEGPHHIITINGEEQFGVTRIIPVEEKTKSNLEERKISSIRERLQQNNLYKSLYTKRKKLSHDILDAYTIYISKQKRLLIGR